MMKWLSDGLSAAVFLTLAACLVLVSGCQKRANVSGSAKISGKVLYNGVPLGFGLVQLYTDAGQIGESAIRGDGAYLIANLPEGEAKICVQAKRRDIVKKERLYEGSGEKPKDESPPTETSRLMGKLTEKYGDVHTTPLMFIIHEGEQQHDIVLSLP